MLSLGHHYEHTFVFPGGDIVAALLTHSLPAPPDAEPVEPSPDEYPCVSEARFERRERERRALPLTDLAAGLPVEAVNYLQDTAFQDALAAMKLRPLERSVLELRVGGVSIREIAVRIGVPKCRVERALHRIRNRFASTRRAPASGWQDVYLAETRRAGKK
jgi:DNA-directed RNA polymerase specialized sigma24 family protein